MVQFIGTKQVRAAKMTRGDYNALRGWAHPEGEDQAVAGYLVEYLDGGAPNDARYAGYISWSPADVFERSYRASAGLTFGLALEVLKAGHRVRRTGWNGKGMWLVLLTPGKTPSDATATLRAVHTVPGSHATSTAGYTLAVQPCIAMRNAHGELQPGWLASQADMLGEDWEIVDGTL